MSIYHRRPQRANCRNHKSQCPFKKKKNDPSQRDWVFLRLFHRHFHHLSFPSLGKEKEKNDSLTTRSFVSEMLSETRRVEGMSGHWNAIRDETLVFILKAKQNVSQVRFMKRKLIRVVWRMTAYLQKRGQNKSRVRVLSFTRRFSIFIHLQKCGGGSTLIPCGSISVH